MDDHEWELCKENVQPLRQGRHLSSLATALHSDHADSAENNLIKEQQNNFEIELRTYDGDDPFDVWDRYVKWTEQYFPKGGHDGQLAILIERCLKEFQGDQRYKNDSRIIRLWIKFACFSDDPVEVYKYMFDNDIGVQLASLYIEWAIATERKGDNKTADALYMLGLKQCIEGKDLLLQRQQQFQNRLARNITLQIAEQQNFGTSIVDEAMKRSTLGRLKPTGPSHKVGATRTGSVLLGSAGRLKDSRPSVPKQLPNKGIPIFCDRENVPPTLPQHPTHEWQTIPVHEIDNRENNKKPGVWTEVKVKQKVGSVPSVLPPTPFQIHVDEEPAGMPQVTPRKTTLIVHSQPLSSRKAAQADVLSGLRQQEDDTVSNVIVMYQKEKIYNGLSEFSFEELRAAKYWKRKKKQDAENERRKEENHKLQLMLMEQDAKIARMEALLSGLAINGPKDNLGHVQIMPELHHHQNNPTHEGRYTDILNNSARADALLSNDLFNRSTINGHQPVMCLGQASSDSGTPLEKYLGNAIGHQGNSSGCLGASEEDKMMHIINHMSNYVSGASNSSSTSTCTSSNTSLKANDKSLLSSCKPGTVEKGQSLSTNEIQSSFRDKYIALSDKSSNSILSDLNKCNQPALEKIPLAVPSPTVHTKEAMECINKLFCESFVSETQATDFELTEVNAEVLSASSAPISLSGTRRSFESSENSPSAPPIKRQNLKASINMPFKIIKDMSPCSDENGVQANSNKGLYIYCDDNGSSQMNSNDQGGGLNILKGLEIFCDSENLREEMIPKPQGKLALSSHRGLQIHCDKLQDAENNRDQVIPMPQVKLGIVSKKIHCDKLQESENQRDQVIPMPLGKLGISSKKGLQIHCDKFHDAENNVKTADIKQSSRRGLSFGSVSSDVEMTEMDKNETKDFTIEWQAVVETTLAPLDQFSSLQAKAASTPCIPANQISNEPQEVTDLMSSCLPVTTLYDEGLTPSKHLSPIFEGSGEGSSEEMKSGSQHSQTSIGVGQKVSKPQRTIYGIKEDIVNEEAMAALGQDVLDSSCYHHIAAITDTHESHDDILSSSLDLDLRDPFDQQVNCKFLETIKPPLCEYPNYMAFDFDLDAIIPGNTIIIGDLTMYIAKCIGEGGYAKIFEVSLHQINHDDTATGPTNIENQVLKFQQPACYWEFYVSCELRRRLSLHKSSMNIIPSIMQIDRGCFYKNASVLQMKLIPWGSLLNLVNFYRKDRMRLSQVEPFACLLTIELLHMFEQIHKSQIIHGDVKPDNFLLLDIPDVKKSKDPKEVFGNKLRIVQLIDFGQSIDMTKFSDGTTFRASVKTSGFQCIEMRTQRPWTFQTDLFGLAGTIHVVLFGSYMNVFQENGLWKITGNYVRKWNVQLWKKFFHELLNIPSCHQQPDLAAMRQTFEEYFIDSCIPQYNKWAQNIRGVEDLWSAREII